MEDLETDLLQTRKARRLEHMVARWLHRSRESMSRGRSSVGDVASEGLGQPGSRVTLTLTIHKDLLLGNYGFEISPNLPLTVASVAAGGTADGKLLPGDQILSINHEAVEHVSIEQAAGLLRDPEDSLLLTVLRCTSGGPKSSFLTAEKRARLKTNPVKVRFAEEVLVNGHSQGNSLLCLPNVLKVYLENGQTKAFRFDATTTVKDILLTLKEKLSIHCIEHFALALEEQYNIAKVYLLHEEELVEQVVQRKDAHDYRCLFRVCFVPKDPLDLLQDDPVTFEYLYLQSCSDVLQERFAVEMKCSVALRLAALHIQERIYACAQPQKVSFKYIAKDWGIENFISPTLLRNMKGKDIKKAISFHMKRNQILLEPRQKHALSASAVRLSYLQILGDLKMYSGKIFNATLMLQDRESYVALLVGAKYGISQIINNKLNIITPLAAFANISRLEFSEESEKVSTVKIYLQDVKLLTLMLESHSAKDLACLIAGYYRLYVDAGVSIFPWGGHAPAHRVSAEEGYESRACSDSEDSWELEPAAERRPDPPWLPPAGEGEAGPGAPEGRSDTTDSASEASDSANTESRGGKTSGSSDSMDALEEDDLEACSVSRPELLALLAPTVRELGSQDAGRLAPGGGWAEPADVLCSQLAGPEPAALRTKLSEDQVLEYYSLCSRISPASNGESSVLGQSPGGGSGRDLPAGPGHGGDPAAGANGRSMHPPPGFGDSSSEEEFYDAPDRLTPTDAQAGWRALSQAGKGEPCVLKRPRGCPARQAGGEAPGKGKEKALKHVRSLRKRRSFLQTDYTSQVTFPLAPACARQSAPPPPCSERGRPLPALSPAPAPGSWGASGDSAWLEASPSAQLGPQGQAPSSAPMDTGPGAGAPTCPKASLAPSHSAPPLPEARGAEGGLHLPENSPRALGSACEQDSGWARPEAACHAGTTGAPRHAGAAWDGARGWPRPLAEAEEGGLTHPAPQAQPIPPRATEALAAHQALETPAQGGAERPAGAEPLRSPDGCSRAEPPPQATDSEPGPLPAAAKGGRWEQLATAGPTGPTGRAATPGADVAPGEGAGKHCSEEPLGRVGKKPPLGFYGATELLSDPPGAAGILTRLSWLSGPRTHPGQPAGGATSPSHSAPPWDSHRPPAAPEVRTPPGLPGARHAEGEPGPGAPGVDRRQGQPRPTLPLLPEEAAEQRQGCLFNAPPGPPPPAPEDAGDASAHGQGSLGADPSLSRAAPLATRCNTAHPSGGTLAPPAGMDTCGCQLAYTSCFPGLASELEPESVDSALSTSSRPLTTPPAARSRSFPGPPAPRALDESHGAGEHGPQPDPPAEALGQLNEDAGTSPPGSPPFLAGVAELQAVVRRFSGARAQHPPAACAEHCSAHKHVLCAEARTLMARCQKVLQPAGPAELHETWQALLRLTARCSQFTACGLCASRHQELALNLQDVLGTYHQFAHAALQAKGKGRQDVSATLLARQGTALSAAVFCLTRRFWAAPAP
ncbi:FERM and PDZ domain-containing protein 1 [Pelodiscus sinensis]|uniref:FERM and PDZ domain-containing protein 1 n=1 Tax=Pelodiscus sinensis TaxID=13735 RepID=UPI003F6A54E6